MNGMKLITSKTSYVRRLFSRVVVACLLFSAPLVQAATLSIDPNTKTVGPGDTFVVTIRLDTAPDECVNAVTAEIFYPKDWMNASAVSKGESLMSLWIEEPSVDREAGRVFMSGGIPAGYCGRVQGDPGKTNIIAKIIFSIPGNMIGGKVATGPITLPITFGPNTTVLLNDGFGSPAPLTLGDASYVRELNSQGLKNEWLDIVHTDNIQPDLFTISVEQHESAFEGKYFIVFAATDKQSGIHHYEIMEDDPENLGFIYGRKTKSSFVTGVSPYVLTDQLLKSRITVRAFDHAGNTQEAVLAPKNGPQGSNSTSKKEWNIVALLSPIWLGVGALTFVLILGGGVWFVRRRKQGEAP
jgi:hypothetical protein